MRTVKQIIDQYSLISEREKPEVGKLQQLSEAGLFDIARLPMMKRAIEKNPRNMTMVEKKALLELANSLMAQVLHEAKQDHLAAYDKRFPKKYPSDRDIPTIIVLKRKAIRVFPDNQKIALYYSQALDKYVSVPFSPKDEALGIHMSEQKKILKKVITEETQELPVPFSPRDSFRKNLTELREEKLNEAPPVLGAAVVAGLRAAAASGAAKTVVKYGKRIVRKAISGAKNLASKAAGAIAGAAASDDEKKSESKPEKKSGGSDYEFTKAGRASHNVSSPQRATADLSSVHSERQRNKAAWKNIQESNFNIIKSIAQNKEASGTIVFGEKTISINNRIAKRIMNLYESLNVENKKKTRAMLNESAESFKKIVNFAVRQG